MSTKGRKSTTKMIAAAVLVELEEQSISHLNCVEGKHFSRGTPTLMMVDSQEKCSSTKHRSLSDDDDLPNCLFYYSPETRGACLLQRKRDLSALTC